MSSYPFTSALVTGASSGIGSEMARQLGEAGVPTVVVARRGDRLEEIAARYDGFEVLEADLLTHDGQASTVERISSTAAPIDLVVNNAGFGTSGVFHELDVDRLSDEVELNVKALTVLSHAALAAMVPRERGYLLNVSSVASFQGSPGLGVYAATKAYVTSLTEALHGEVKGSGVHVTALCPGLTKTEFQEHSNTTGLALKVPDLAWTTVEQVATTGLRDVASNKTISVPGALYKVAVTGSDILPRSITRWVSGTISR
ncbi:MAG TPA: SDR family oxidoreductase [Ilumatobacteraceae bacterium]|nr:SDR family oxidoreductase [Ilumatobacteraceae bacterium]